MAMLDTIVALSTAPGKAALAVVRVSGPQVRFITETILTRPLHPRVATRVKVVDPARGLVLDDAVAVLFAGPASATGEDVLELSLHGSMAVVRAVLALVTSIGPGIRLAEPGEFSRRALENGKLDLLQIEALGDLLDAETESQRQQATRLLEGRFGETVRGLRDQLMQARALLEAEIDFSDEGDVAGPLQDEAIATARSVADIMAGWLQGAAAGRRIRDGARVVLVGAPNAGKSSLMNVLAARDVSIVSTIPGTTRDRIEAALDIGGFPVVLSDTAGVRDAHDPVEAEGVTRSLRAAREADLILSLRAPGTNHVRLEDGEAPILRLATMADIAGQQAEAGELAVSSRTGAGISTLMDRIIVHLSGKSCGSSAVVARARQEEALTRAHAALMRAVVPGLAVELVAEELRAAAHQLGHLVGDVDVEQVLDRLFAGFCIGK